jgi:hypothetical protein
MITNPATEFTTLTVSCFDVPIDVLWGELELLFVEHRLDVNGQRRRFDYEDLGLTPSRGATAAKGVVFTPFQGKTQGTAMLTNLIDGWQTLGVAVSARLTCNCWQFTVSNREEHPRNAFTFIEDGLKRRVVSVQRDPQWVFFAKGDVLDIETEALYTQRRVKDRVTPEYVLALAKKAGFPIGEDAFWTTDDSSIAFSETRRHVAR